MNVAGHADDLHMLLLCPFVINELSDGALVRPHGPRERLAHDRDGWRVREVGTGQRPTRLDRNTHRLEIARRHGAHVADRLRALRRRRPAWHGEVARRPVAGEWQE